MTREVMVIGPDLGRVMSLATGFPEMPLVTTMIETARPVVRLLASTAGRPDAAIVWLTDHDNVVDIRTVVRRWPDTRFLFLTAVFPPSPAMSRIIRSSGGVALSESESNVVIMATLLALLARSRTTPEAL